MATGADREARSESKHFQEAADCYRAAKTRRAVAHCARRTREARTRGRQSTEVNASQFCVNAGADWNARIPIRRFARSVASYRVEQLENLMTKIAAFVLLAVLAGYGFHTLAQVRPEIRQSVMPIGTSSSNGVSFVWLYEPTERTVYACRAGQGGGDTVECKGRTTLP